MTEQQFWELMGLLDWKKLGNDYAVVRPLVRALAKLAEGEIFGFDDLLAEKLHALDTEAHARHMGENSYKGLDEFFSVDLFLYTRCAVVANGKDVFEQILADPNEFPGGAEFEAIPYVAGTAYEKKTGKEYTHSPAVNFEIFSNKDGWSSMSEKTNPLGSGLLVPPWVFRQGLSRISPEWQKGDAAAYIEKWTAWLRIVLRLKNGRDPLRLLEEPAHCLPIARSCRRVCEVDHRAAPQGDHEHISRDDPTPLDRKQPRATEDGVGPKRLWRGNETMVGHNEYRRSITNARAIECPHDTADVGIVEGDGRETGGRSRAKAVVSRIDIVEVKSQKSRHPIPDHLTCGFSPDLVLDDIVAPLESLEQPFPGQFVLELRCRIGEGAWDVGEVVVDCGRAPCARPVDGRRRLPGLLEDVKQEGNTDQLLLSP
jgi:Protein of unknown function (DUF4240)